MTDLPQKFIERMQERLGEEFPAFLRSYETPPARGLRVNPLKISAEEFGRILPFSLKPVPWEKNGFYIEAEKAGGEVEHFAGLYYLQEPSAMCAAPLLDAQPGERVLDLCAAPGGKTTQLAGAMMGKGILIANEIDGLRAKILLQNVERMGVSNCAVISAAPQKLSGRFSAFFDKILVDAPCSGEGMFKREPNAIPEWSEQNVKRCAARQREILDCAAELLKCGGRLVYSTCTFAEEEDEFQIEAFLERHPEFRLKSQYKIYPHRTRGEGHFAALFEKEAGQINGAKMYRSESDPAAEEGYWAFAKDFFEEGKMPCVRPTVLPDGRMFSVPEGMPDLRKLRLLRLGVELGEWDGKIFKPAHALVMAFGAEARRKIKLGAQSAERFLHGEQMETDLENGWCAVCAGEFPIGLGKAVNGALKNHLPKGLRMIRKN